jgi:hypothetical protein
MMKKKTRTWVSLKAAYLERMRVGWKGEKEGRGEFLKNSRETGKKS